jgi:fructose-1,6-bisphosphatase/inositol monophosphatase family enzyme
MAANLPTPAELVLAGKRSALAVWRLVDFLRRQGRLGQRAAGGAHKSANNTTYWADVIAQRTVENEIKTVVEDLFGCELLILGEEKDKYPESLDDYKGLVAIVDPIDGTDLAVKGFSNWCVALAFFFPPERKILAAIVGHSSGQLYYATENEAYREVESRQYRADGSYVVEIVRSRLERSAEKDIKLEDAAICFYGQKPRSFLNLASDARFCDLLKQFSERMRDKHRPDGSLEKRGEELKFRLYNLAGNPMMARIPEGVVDAVLGLSQQEVHDVIPGAYIAQQAGSVFRNLEGQPIDPASSLMRPRSKLSYILCASNSLADDLQGILGLRAERTTGTAGTSVRVPLPPSPSC